MVIDEKLIAKNMELLRISREEAIQMILDDMDIDHGKRMDFDLTPEQEKEAKKYFRADSKEPGTVKRTRKPDEEKELVIRELALFLEENVEFCAENVEITNKNNEVCFKIGDNDYYFKLTKRRKPK